MLEHIIFVRHGESRHHVERLTGGWTDTSLTAAGIAQARTAGTHLATLPLEDFAFVTSDLKRAAETASAIGDIVGRTPTPLRSLREINNGVATGLTIDEAKAIARHRPADQWDPDWRGYDEAEYPSAEIKDEFGAFAT